MTAIQNAEAITAALPSIIEVRRKVARKVFLLSFLTFSIITAVFGIFAYYQLEAAKSRMTDAGSMKITDSQISEIIKLIEITSNDQGVPTQSFIIPIEEKYGKSIRDLNQMEALETMMSLVSAMHRVPPHRLARPQTAPACLLDEADCTLYGARQ